MTLQLGPVIGRLGGGGSSTMAVEANVQATDSAPLEEVTLPPGQWWVVGVVGTASYGGTNRDRAPLISLSTGESTGGLLDGESVAISTWVEGGATVLAELVGRASSAPSGFAGTLYTMPLPD